MTKNKTPKEKAMKHLELIKCDLAYNRCNECQKVVSEALDIAIQQKANSDIKVLEELRKKRCYFEVKQNKCVDDGNKCDSCKLFFKAIKKIKRLDKLLEK